MSDSKRIALLIDCDNVSHEAIEGVLEELAKLVLGQQNRLRHLGNYQEMMRSTSRGRTMEIEYPKAPAAEQTASPAGSGLLDNLKSLLKR